MAVVKMLEFDPGTYEYAGFIAPTASTLVPGFVHLSGTAYKLTNTLASGTKSPIGVVMASYASGSTGVTVRTNGLVWMTLGTGVKASAGQPVFPGAKGTVVVKGVNDASGNAKLGNRGFGTVIVGGASATDILVKLERM